MVYKELTDFSEMCFNGQKQGLATSTFEYTLMVKHDKMPQKESGEQSPQKSMASWRRKLGLESSQ